MIRDTTGKDHEASVYAEVPETARRQLVLAPVALVVAALLSAFAFRAPTGQGAGQHREIAASAVSAPVFVTTSKNGVDDRYAVLTSTSHR